MWHDGRYINPKQSERWSKVMAIRNDFNRDEERREPFGVFNHYGEAWMCDEGSVYKNKCV